MDAVPLLSEAELTAEIAQLLKSFREESSPRRFEAAMAQAQRLGMADSQIQARLALGCWLYEQQRPQEAGAQYAQALAQARAVSDEHPAVARLLNGLGIVAITQGEYAAAEEYYSQSLELARQNHDLSGIARALNNMALLWSRLGQPGRALEDLLQSQEMFLRVQHPVNTFVVALNLLWVLVELGRYQQALSVSTLYLSLAQEHDLIDRQVDILSVRAACQGQLSQGQPGQEAAARATIEQTLTLMERSTAKHDATNHVLLATAYAGLKDYPRTRAALEKAVCYAETDHNLDMLAMAHHALVRLHRMLGQHQDMEQHIRAYQATQQKLFLPVTLFSAAGEPQEDSLNNTIPAHERA